MIRGSWTRTASIEETLALWAAALREIKTHIALVVIESELVFRGLKTVLNWDQ
jgi:hypothetical protein